MDVIKTRMQRFPSSYSSIRTSAIRIWTIDGPRAFFLGMSTPLLGSAFSEALQFTVFGGIKESFQKYSGNS